MVSKIQCKYLSVSEQEHNLPSVFNIPPIFLDIPLGYLLKE